MSRSTKGGLTLALAGNPNVGKSTLFNALTGMHQHTGNWPGKTVQLAEGRAWADGREVRLVDLPGTYSLSSHSPEEEVARDFILGGCDGVIVVLDATALERNLILALQILEMTPKVVLCLNLMDEAARRGFKVDPDALRRQLGVPVVPTAAAKKRGLRELMEAAVAMAEEPGVITAEPPKTKDESDYKNSGMNGREDTARRGGDRRPGCPHGLACRGCPYAGRNALERYRALYGGETEEAAMEPPRDPVHYGRAEPVIGALTGVLGSRYAALVALELATGAPPDRTKKETWTLIEGARARLKVLIDAAPETYGAQCRAKQAGRVAGKVVSGGHRSGRVDRILTSKRFGIPIMIAFLALILWITIAGANVPSAYLAQGFEALKGWLSPALAGLGMAPFLVGLLVDGMVGTLGWVVSVMLPPMAIFFPLFTLLEDLGVLPRIAFNLDGYFQRAKACGKQALTMCMGLGCNAVGVVGCRIIDSERERMIAVLTNNFMPCNGRLPPPRLGGRREGRRGDRRLSAGARRWGEGARRSGAGVRSSGRRGGPNADAPRRSGFWLRPGRQQGAEPGFQIGAGFEMDADGLQLHGASLLLATTYSKAGMSYAKGGERR